MKSISIPLTMAGFALMGVGILFMPKAHLNDTPQITMVAPPSSARPLNLRIPRIGVNAPIEPVGIVNGAMGAPAFGYSVGWYSLGTRPGETGSAVLAGHVNYRGGQDAVFTHLDKLSIGDIVTVTDSYGQAEHFVVKDLKIYPLDGDTSDVFSVNDGIARLNLITCDGVWNPWLGTHESRLVVFTEKI